jgi:hypothetical protein
MRRLVLIVLALGSIAFACWPPADEPVTVQPVAVTPENLKEMKAAAAAPGTVACEGPCGPDGAGHAAVKPGEHALAPGPRVFGAPLQAEGEPVAVAALLEDPKPYLGKVVKAKGTVSRVCEKAGCWIELAPQQGSQGLRVPMANHAFFIPGDAIGRPAIVEGQLNAQALPAAHKEHLAGEGAQALGPLSLAATTVVVQ